MTDRHSGMCVSGMVDLFITPVMTGISAANEILHCVSKSSHFLTVCNFVKS